VRYTGAHQAASPTIPIVLIAAGPDQVAKLVSSLAQPGGRVTGLTLMQRDLGGKRLELLKKVASRVSRVAVLAAHLPWRELETAAN
jgi:putative tryptophan/tyrosine transport system substrate-binding protein